MSFFSNLYQRYGPWFMPKIRFNSVFWELFYRINPNFVCALILKWSILGLFHVIFPNLYQSHGPLFLRQNFVSAQYIENRLTEFYQILYMHSYWQDLAWDCYTSFVPELWPLIYAKISCISISIEQIDRFSPKIVSEYDQEIPQSQTADNPVAPRGRAAQPSRDTRKTN